MVVVVVFFYQSINYKFTNEEYVLFQDKPYVGRVKILIIAIMS